MRVGFALPQFGPQAQSADRVPWFAAEAERLGAASLWVGDRLLAPVAPVVGYGGTDTIPAHFRSVLDPFTVLTAAAVATNSVLLGTSVLNLPWYPPIVLARALTSIDRLSGGRLIPGFGSGWSPDEYQAVNVPFRSRGARLDEGLDALEAIWSTSPAEYDGMTWTMPASYVDLTPAQRPRPPIFLGGYSAAALRRIGRRADGWLPAGRLPGAIEPEFFLAQRQVIQRAAGEAGRDGDEIRTVLRVNAPAGTKVSEIVAAMDRVAGRTGIEDFFVDLANMAASADEMLDVAGEIMASA
jgi:probable F420-dependent oxidoreductase